MDVVVLDCVQLAVGSVGRFGSGASSLVSVLLLIICARFSRKCTSAARPSSFSGSSGLVVYENNSFFHLDLFSVAHMTIHLPDPYIPTIWSEYHWDLSAKTQVVFDDLKCRVSSSK